MRALALKNTLPDWEFQVIDISQIISSASRFSKSLAFRFNSGPVVTGLNALILKNAKGLYDLIWVDKAIWLKEETVEYLKSISKKLLHYTPDCAFVINRSHHFDRAVKYYDIFVTTKSFEKEYYPLDRTIFVHQGYDHEFHKPYYSFENKFRDVVFIGLYEESRHQIIDLLLRKGIKVSICGVGWRRIKSSNRLEFLGDRLFGEDYARTISSSFFSLGLLSKKFPELHTTRTIEIPACQSALVTEGNSEIRSMFNDDQVIFFKNIEEIPDRIKYFLSHKEQLKRVTENGYNCVLNSAFSYNSIVQTILKKASIDTHV